MTNYTDEEKSPDADVPVLVDEYEPIDSGGLKNHILSTTEIFPCQKIKDKCFLFRLVYMKTTLNK